jgi:hypothetical protein
MVNPNLEQYKLAGSRETPTPPRVLINSASFVMISVKRPVCAKNGSRHGDETERQQRDMQPCDEPEAAVGVVLGTLVEPWRQTVLRSVTSVEGK